MDIKKAPFLLTPITAAITLLKILRSCDMPAEEAHKIAETHANLPAVMTMTARRDCIDLTYEVLDDLRSRKVEKQLPTQVSGRDRREFERFMRGGLE